MSEADTLSNVLDQIEKTITANKSLTVKAFGILLLGKKFDDELTKKEVADPTELILGRGLDTPNL